MWYQQSYARSVPCDKKQHFNVSTFMEFVYSSDHIGRVQAIPFIDGLIDHTFVLKSSSDKPDMPTELAYREDMKKLQIFIPPETVNGFYAEIFQWPTTDTRDIELIT
ncbi:hypothetical protein PR048_002064 [Dryococelus australis]|uniref:Uncharacterized protein n=1 Tax=Dryococelus australis TaxID=614101 RepID=A0ABQ9IJ38_9NEOP|nr:hypothetical protein PR048_002064 [Dryococelus australis]